MSKGLKTRMAILTEALRAASVEGFQGISIGMLADRLKLSTSGPFAHFGSKEGPEKAVLAQAGQRFVAKVWAPARSAPRGERKSVGRGTSVLIRVDRGGQRS